MLEITGIPTLSRVMPVTDTSIQADNPLHGVMEGGDRKGQGMATGPWNAGGLLEGLSLK